MKYQNRKNGKIAVFVRDNGDKYKTVTLRYEDGKEMDYQYSTLRKSFKKLPDDVETELVEEVKTDADYVAEVMKQKEELGIDVPELNPDDIEVVEPKTEKKARKKKEITVAVNNLLNYVEEVMSEIGGNVKVPRNDAMKFRALCNDGGRQFCKLMWSANKIRLYFRSDVVCEAYADYVKVNYNLPYLYEINNYNDETLEKIKNLLILGINNDYRKTK